MEQFLAFNQSQIKKDDFDGEMLHEEIIGVQKKFEYENIEIYKKIIQLTEK